MAVDEAVRYKAIPPRKSDGAKKWIEGEDQYPDVRHWHQIVFLVWKDECAKAGSNVAELKHIFIRESCDKVTVELLHYSVKKQRERDEIKTPRPEWIGKLNTRSQVFLPQDGKAFYPLLAAPDIEHVVKLLVVYRPKLGNKTISGIKVGLRSCRLA